MALLRWLKTICSQWVAEVTGGALVGALALYSALSGKTVSPKPYFAVVVFAFLHAMFLAWRQEETKTLKAEACVRELREHTPRFLTSLAASLGSVGGHVQVLTDLTVYNQGNKSSILKDWGFKYSDLVGGPEHHIVHMPINISIDPVRGIEQMGNPISTDSGVPPGGERTYRRSYPLDWSMEEIRNHGLTITITFADIDDRPYSVSAEFPKRFVY